VCGDPKHTLAKHLIAEAIVPDLFVYHSEKEGLNTSQRRWISNHPFMSKYLHGVVQPALTIVRSNRTIAYSMPQSMPTLSNGYGAVGRPDVDQVWAAFKHSGPDGKIDGSQFRKQKLTDELYVWGSAVGYGGLAVVMALYLTSLWSTRTTLVVAGVIVFAMVLLWLHLLGVLKQPVTNRGKAATIHMPKTADTRSGPATCKS